MISLLFLLFAYAYLQSPYLVSYTFLHVIYWYRSFKINLKGVNIDDVEMVYWLPEEMFKIPMEISLKGLRLVNEDKGKLYPIWLRFDYQYYGLKFSQSDIYKINIKKINGDVVKSYYVKLDIYDRIKLWFYFGWKRTLLTVRKMFQGIIEVVVKHFMKIIIISLLTWFSISGGLNSCNREMPDLYPKIDNVINDGLNDLGL